MKVFIKKKYIKKDDIKEIYMNEEEGGETKNAQDTEQYHGDNTESLQE